VRLVDLIPDAEVVWPRAQCHIAIALWLLGSPAQALQPTQRDRLAERLDHPFWPAVCPLDKLALLHLLRGEWGGAAMRTGRQYPGRAQGFRFFEADAHAARGPCPGGA
jgi:hypothetical protein